MFIYHKSYLTQPHLSWPFSSELSGCEATRFAVAAANQDALRVKADSEAVDTTLVTWRRQSPSSKLVLIRRSHGELSRFTAPFIQTK